jgi:hypothetical protein
VKENDLAKRLAKDKRVGLNATIIKSLIQEGQKRIGAANSQVDYFVASADSWAKRYPTAQEYTPPSIL